MIVQIQSPNRKMIIFKLLVHIFINIKLVVKINEYEIIHSLTPHYIVELFFKMIASN